MGLRINECVTFALLTLTFASILLTTVLSLSSPTTMVYVSPEKIEPFVGQSFTIEVRISNAENIYGWEFMLKWNPNLLDVIKVSEGDFLKRGGGTFFTTNRSGEAGGLIIVDCTLLSNVPGVDGDGTLATIEFYAKVQGKCILELKETILVDESERPVLHTVGNGEVTVKPLNFIDWLRLNLQIISFIIAILVVIMSLLFIKFRRLKVKPLGIRQAIPHFDIFNDEEKIVRLLKSAGGRLLQSSIADQLKFSKSKTSSLLKMMEAKGKIRRERKGRDKVVILIGENTG